MEIAQKVTNTRVMDMAYCNGRYKFVAILQSLGHHVHILDDSYKMASDQLWLSATDYSYKYTDRLQREKSS